MCANNLFNSISLCFLPWNIFYSLRKLQNRQIRTLASWPINSCGFINQTKGKHLCIYWNYTCKCYSLVAGNHPTHQLPTELLRAPHKISEASLIIEHSQIIHGAVAFVTHHQQQSRVLRAVSAPGLYFHIMCLFFCHITS